MVNSGLRERLVQRHVQVEPPDKCLDDLGDDGWSTGSAKSNHRLAISEDDSWTHARERTLPWRNRIRLGTDQAKKVGHARLNGKIVHLVIQQDACARDDDLRAERRVQCGRAGHPVALRVSRRKMRRVLAEKILHGGGRSARLSNHCDTIGLNFLGQLRRVCFGSKPPRHACEIRIAKPISAIGKSQFHGFAHDMNCVRRIGTHRLQIEVFQNIQYLAHEHATGAGRRKTNNAVAAIGRHNGISHSDLVEGKIGAEQHTAMTGHPFAHRHRKWTIIKPARSQRCNCSVGSAKLRLLQQITRRLWFAVRQKEQAGIWPVELKIIR